VIQDVIYASTMAAALAGSPRWLRIAQREHYIAGSVSRFAIRWWASSYLNKTLGAMLVLALAVAWAGFWPGSLAVGVISLLGPLGLSYRGRSSKLAWTRRLRVLAIATACLVLLVAVLGTLVGALPAIGATVAAAAPVLIDLALFATTPLERRSANRFAQQATQRLTEVSPRIVAITGSYGKTTTKFYTAHLLREKYATLASPASFNNRSGLSRAINERLTPGTEIFVAEMGTYGPGEIRALCDWLTPEISVITAIGPVHLERMGSVDNIARAKAEILEHAKVGVLNVDSPHLAEIAGNFERQGGKLIRCSALDSTADVHVASVPVASGGDELRISAYGELLGAITLPNVFPTNLACAIGVALAMDISASDIAARLATLPATEHRQAVLRAANDVILIDDTYNSNPAGAAQALATLASLAADQRRVVVTPGMVELGREQFSANEQFARLAATAATDILIVGRTNSRALLRGAKTGPAKIQLCADRSEAVAWVRRNLVSGDAVLYENDLPDHYP
jgi:UDP-N-acetylmuramoyl-tripeptide--D-alanyl-D-alanine ligase